METLGDRIKLAREGKGLTQADLASALDTQWQQVSRWERNQSVPRAKTLKRISAETQSSFEWLQTGKGFKTDLETLTYLKQTPGEQSKAEEAQPYHEDRVAEPSLLERGLLTALELRSTQTPAQMVKAVVDAYAIACKPGRAQDMEDLVRRLM